MNTHGRISRHTRQGSPCPPPSDDFFTTPGKKGKTGKGKPEVRSPHHGGAGPRDTGTQYDN